MVLQKRKISQNTSILQDIGAAGGGPT
jgi:hypothetical protein